MNGIKKMLSFNHIGNLGRLANQMFQYASLKGIARNRGYDFCIPPQNVYGQIDPVVTKGLNIFDVFEQIGDNNIQLTKNEVVYEETFEFNKEIFDNCPDNVDLYGYYQSSKYFDHVKEEIKKDFTFSNEVERLCSDMIESIRDNKKLIALHIRRTDYTVNPNHPVQPISYYENALKKFDKNDKIIVFSDDPKWCQQQEIFADESIMISEDNDADIDMCLMSKCNYHIIANSSFSWWGAWLADSEQVIAPKNWFGGDCASKSIKDIPFGNFLFI